jgi:hypothetical protein
VGDQSLAVICHWADGLVYFWAGMAEMAVSSTIAQLSAISARELRFWAVGLCVVVGERQGQNEDRSAP